MKTAQPASLPLGLRVGRNDAVGQSLNSGSFLRGKELPGAGLDRFGRGSRIGMPRQMALDDAGASRRLADNDHGGGCQDVSPA